MNDFLINAIITGDSSGYIKALLSANKATDTFSKNVSTLKKLMTTALGAMGVSFGVTQLIRFGKESSKYADEAAKRYKILENTVKATGASTWTSTKELVQMSDELAKSTDYTTAEIQKMHSVLLGFKNIKEEGFSEATDAVLDMATVMGMDLASAAQAVGKALDDPIKGIGSLSRQGFAFTEQQKEQLQVLWESGKTYEAQKIILDELNTTYGGAAKSAKSFSESYKKSIDSFKEELGYNWQSAFQPFQEAIQETIDKWTEYLKKQREANESFENLKKTLSGKGGNVKDAKSLQMGVNTQLQQEYRDLSKFVEIAKKSAKERTQIERDMYEEMMGLYGSYISRYQAEGYEFIDAIKKVQEDKKAEWKKGLDDFQQIIAKEKELEEEQARLEAERLQQESENERQAREARKNNLIAAYDETIAKAREEIEIHRQMGEKISDLEEKQQLLNVMKQAYVKMIQESNGELKIEKARLESIINLHNELNKQLPKSKSLLEELQRMTKEMLENSESEWNGYEQAVINVYAEILEEASSWTDFFVDTFHTFKDVGKQAIETIGQSLVEGEDAWQNMGAVALESIAQILEALAKELAALAVVNASHYNYGQAAAAAAGATAALVGAGALKGMASQMKKVSKDTQTLVDALKDLKNEVKSIQQAGSSGKISDIANAYAQSVNAVKEAQDALSQSVTKDTWDVYLQSMNSYSESISGLDTSLEGISESLDLQIYAFREIYSATDKVSKNILKNKVLSDLKSQLVSAYSDIENIGKDIGELIMNGVTEGVATSNFLSDVKKYIVNAMTKIAVFTESFQKQLADATSGMLVGITTGDDSIIENSTKAIKNLYETALSTADAIEGSITGIFNNIDTKTKSTVKSLQDTINDIKKEGFTDISKTLQGRSALTQKIAEAKSKLDKALSDYQSSSIPNAINEITYGEKAGYTRQINELQRAINTYSEKIIELNKQRESLEWTVGYSAPSELYRGDEKFFQEYLVYLNMGIDKATALMKAGLNESWADQKWNWEMAKRDLEDVNSAINTYQNLIKNTTPRIDTFNEKIDETDSKISELRSEYKNLEKAYKDADDAYQEAKGLIDNSMRELSDNLKAQNKELDNQILLYKELYTSTNASFNSAVLETSLNKIKSAFYSFFEDLQDMGLTVGENLVNAIADGMSQADFLGSMKDYIRKAILQTVVYTETLQHEIAQIGATISKGIAEGFTDTGLHEIKRDLSYIFYMAQNSISKIDSVLDNVFSGYATGTQNATRGLHLVGEAGPELVRFRGGEQVLNAGNTQKALNGAGTTINQNVTFNNLNDTSAFAMMQQFKRYNREMAINGVF